ncbi:MAG TPA: glycosyltransferase family 39 protein [Ignavibacteriaceae bacterium]|nr:glycosyltransferase family 39 protein [Ignavibacteriaceae bacterium]
MNNANSITPEYSLKEKLLSTTAVLIYLSFFKLILLIIFSGNYGLFRDEYYYIEVSKHLDWGYVDMQPLSALFLALSRVIFGDSIFGIKIFSYLSGSAIVFVSGLIAREMKAGRFAQIFTAVVVIFSGVILGASSYFSMNSFDILLSALMFYYLIRLLNSGNAKLWLVIGLLFGLGLQNKLTFVFLGFGLVVGLILTKNRKYLKSKEIWIGAAIAFLIFLPNIIWQIANNYPTLEFMHNASAYKNRPMGLTEFFIKSLFELNPGYTLFLFTGLYFLFFNRDGKTYSIIGWIYISVFLVFVFNNGKPYYMGVLFPVILAAGVIGADYLIQRYLRPFVRIILVILVIPFFFIVTPFAIPVLPVESFISLEKAMGMKPVNEERSELGWLPQFYADRFGWEEMVQQVAEVYNKLPAKEKKEALIFGQNYGEAGAVNFYRKKYNLPQAISAHNDYWIWGYPQDFKGDVLIVIGSNYKDNSEYFEDVKLAASHSSKYGMPFENVDIFVCKKSKMPMKGIWQRIKFFI